MLQYNATTKQKKGNAETLFEKSKNKKKVMKNANMKKIYLNILSRRIESRQELRIDYKIMKYKQISS